MRSVIEREYDVVGEVADGRSLVTEALKLRPDVIVLDIGMPMLNGIEAARQIKKAWPAAKLLFVTMHANLMYVRETMGAGSCGYVLKTSAAEELLPALRIVCEGGVYVTPELQGSLSDWPQQRGAEASGLTGRQREVLQLVAEGRSSKEVAKILGIAVKTAEFHRHQLMRRLGLGSIAELAAFAVREGYIK
jgi:DNA-binding NarL/FixJ family response regulator